MFLLPGLVTLELLFGKKYRTLGIMERLAAKWKQTLALKSNNKTEGRGTREGASSLVLYSIAKDHKAVYLNESFNFS